PGAASDVAEDAQDRAGQRIHAQNLSGAEVEDEEVVGHRIERKPQQMGTRAGDDELPQQLPVAVEDDDLARARRCARRRKAEGRNVDVAAGVDGETLGRRRTRRQRSEGRGGAAVPGERRYREQCTDEKGDHPQPWTFHHDGSPRQNAGIATARRVSKTLITFRRRAFRSEASYCPPRRSPCNARAPAVPAIASAADTRPGWYRDPWDSR